MLRDTYYATAVNNVPEQTSVNTTADDIARKSIDINLLQLDGLSVCLHSD